MIQAADLTVLAGLMQRQRASNAALAALVAGEPRPAAIGADEPGKGELVDFVA